MAQLHCFVPPSPHCLWPNHCTALVYLLGCLRTIALPVYLLYCLRSCVYMCAASGLAGLEQFGSVSSDRMLVRMLQMLCTGDLRVGSSRLE